MPLDETALPKSVYPLASQAGNSIPLNVARPIAGYFQGVAGGTGWTLALDNTRFNIISVHSTQMARLSSIEDAVVGEDAPVADTFIMLPNVLYELNVNKNVTITNLGSDPATVVLNHLTRWDQLQNIGAYGVSR